MGTPYFLTNQRIALIMFMYCMPVASHKPSLLVNIPCLFAITQHINHAGSTHLQIPLADGYQLSTNLLVR